MQFHSGKLSVILSQRISNQIIWTIATMCRRSETIFVKRNMSLCSVLDASWFIFAKKHEKLPRKKCTDHIPFVGQSCGKWMATATTTQLNQAHINKSGLCAHESHDSLCYTSMWCLLYSHQFVRCSFFQLRLHLQFYRPNTHTPSDILSFSLAIFNCMPKPIWAKLARK